MYARLTLKCARPGFNDLHTRVGLSDWGKGEWGMARRLPGRWPEGFRMVACSAYLLFCPGSAMAFGLAACKNPPTTHSRPWRRVVKRTTASGSSTTSSGSVSLSSSSLSKDCSSIHLWRFRHRPKMAHGRPVPVHGNTTLEIAWTIIPAVILVLISIPTLQVLAEFIFSARRLPTCGLTSSAISSSSSSGTSRMAAIHQYPAHS